MKTTWLVSLLTALCLSVPVFAQDGGYARPSVASVAQRDGRVSARERWRVAELRRDELRRERIRRELAAREFARAEWNRRNAREHYRAVVAQNRRERADAYRTHWQ